MLSRTTVHLTSITKKKGYVVTKDMLRNFETDVEFSEKRPLAFLCFIVEIQLC
jgi:hypothetical protein